jgi:hypothetical protein
LVSGPDLEGEALHPTTVKAIATDTPDLNGARLREETGKTVERVPAPLEHPLEGA